MINLFINYYIDKVEKRQLEFETCIFKNISNTLIDKVVIVCDEDCLDKCIATFGDSKTIIIKHERPSYNFLFELTNKFIDSINIIANTDIFFDETLQLIKDFDWENNDKICMALTRWDLLPSGSLRHFYRIDSQDVWVFFGCVPKIDGAYFTMGVPGCDNKIAYLLQLNGYKVINPSLTIKTIHLHQSNVRNYTHTKEAQTLFPPFLLLKPTEL